MKNKSTIEIIISSILIILSILILNPFHFWMPDMMLFIILVLTFVVFAFFAVFVIREEAIDERAIVHRMLAGRIAFISGSAILTIGIITQAIKDSVDVWLVATLVVMILSKLITRIYSDKKL